MRDFNQIHKQYRPKILGFIIKSTKDIELAEDLTNEVMIKLWNNLDRFDESKSNLNTWIIAMAKNQIIDHWRKKKLDTVAINQFVDDEGNEMIQLPSYITPASEMINSQLGESIHKAINDLPERYKELADMFFINQLSYNEIEDRTGMPMGTIKGSINRLRSLLQESLAHLKFA